MHTLLSHIPNRGIKPRKSGISIVDDTGIHFSDLRKILESFSNSIDYVRLNPETIISQQDISQKITLYKEFGIKPFFSGLLFEAAYIRNQLPDFFNFVTNSNISVIEISDTIIQLPIDEKEDIITSLSKNNEVLAKVGPRKNSYDFPSKDWKLQIDSSLNAGASHVIIEGNEAGISLFYNGVHEVKDSLVFTIQSLAPIEKIIWEAPHVNQQQWYVTQFGAHVNIAHISLQDIQTLETIRLGLHASTLLQHLPENVSIGKVRKFDTTYTIDWQI